jgi:acetyltransferase-like isoleucine patch superfamily enzyme
MATHFAGWFVPPYYGRSSLAKMNSKGYISPSAVIHHSDLKLGSNVFIDDRVMIFQSKNGGPVELGNNVRMYRDTIIQSGMNGSVIIEDNIVIQPRCQFSAYLSSIEIRHGAQIAPNCAFYPYDHSYAPDKPIYMQPLRSKGGILIDEDSWLGFNVIVLDGVKIGKGAIVGAGSVVTRDIPAGVIAGGNPARVIGSR